MAPWGLQGVLLALGMESSTEMQTPLFAFPGRVTQGRCKPWMSKFSGGAKSCLAHSG